MSAKMPRRPKQVKKVNVSQDEELFGPVAAELRQLNTTFTNWPRPPNSISRSTKDVP
jgi:hypothetical protein